MIIKCPITDKRYERIDFSKYHDEDCPFCQKGKIDKLQKHNNNYGKSKRFN
jgi:hypothetical protein